MLDTVGPTVNVYMYIYVTLCFLLSAKCNRLVHFKHQQSANSPVHIDMMMTMVMMMILVMKKVMMMVMMMLKMMIMALTELKY